MQSLLHRELVCLFNLSVLCLIARKLFVLSHIGVLTSIGQPVDIPIITRSLADSIALGPEDAILPTFENDFLATLDIGSHKTDDKCQVVRKYHLNWWSGRKPRNLDNVQILDSSTVNSCLDHYNRQRITPTSELDSLDPSSSTDKSPQTAQLDPTAGAGADASVDANAGAGTGYNFGTSLTGKSGACPKCDKYRQLLSDVLLDTLKFRNFASTMSTSSSNHLKRGLRKTSVFHILHTTAILKETAGPAISQPAPPNLPQSSYKWTWGETLTKEEVLSLCSSATKGGKDPHSGYVVSLPDGKVSGDDSNNPPSLTSQGLFDTIPADASLDLPLTNLTFPAYFSRHENQAGSHRQSTYSLARNLLNADNISTSAPHAQEIVDDWMSGTEGGSGTGSDISDQVLPAGQSHLADIWIDNDGTSDQGQSPQSDAVSPSSLPGPICDISDVWLDQDIDGPLVSQPPAPASVFDIAEVWPDDDHNSVCDQNSGNKPLASSLIHNKLQGPPANLISEVWTDNDVVEDVIVATDHLPAHHFDVADNWTDGSAGSPVTGHVVDEWSDGSVPTSPPHVPTRIYGPDDFAFLQDHMFEEESTDEE